MSQNRSVWAIITCFDLENEVSDRNPPLELEGGVNGYLLSELEQEEWVALRPALGRLREEQKQLQALYGQLNAENAILATLAERLEDLLQRARTELTGLLSEHAALKNAYKRLIGQP